MGRTRNLFAEAKADEAQGQRDAQIRRVHFGVAKMLREYADLIENATDQKRLSVVRFNHNNDMGARLAGTKNTVKYDADNFRVSLDLEVAVSRAVYTTAERDFIGGDVEADEQDKEHQHHE